MHTQVHRFQVISTIAPALPSSLPRRYQRIAEHKKAEKEREAPAQPSGEGTSPGAGAAQQAQRAGPQLPPLAAAYSQLTRFEAAPSTQSCSLQVRQLCPWC